MRRFKLHLFDLDDTLINTRNTYYNAQEIALKQIFPLIRSDDFSWSLDELRWLCRACGSDNAELYMEAFLRSHSSYTPEIQSVLHMEYQEHYWTNLEILEGAYNYLEHLSNAEIPIALVSNGQKKIQRKKLKITGLDRFFSEDNSFISSNYPTANKKPSPYMIQLACEKYGIAPEETIYYGNNSEDIMAGNLANTTTAYFGDVAYLKEMLPGIANPDLIVSAWYSEFKPFQSLAYDTPICNECAAT